jgi:hypothetical protein
MIGHIRALLEGVDICVDEVADILDVVPAKIAPEARRARPVTLETAVLEPRKEIVGASLDTRDSPVSPVDAVLAARMVGMRYWIIAKEFVETLQSDQPFLAGGGSVRDAV